MKICVFTHTFPRYKNDSTAAFMHNLCEGLVKNDNKVTVLAPYDTAYNWKSREKSYKIVTYKYIYPKKYHLLGYSRALKQGNKLYASSYILFPFMLIFGFIALLKLVSSNNNQIDLIYAPWIIPNGFIAALVTTITKTPVVVSLPGSDAYLAKSNKLFAKIAKWSGEKADAVVSDSPQYMNILLDLGLKPRIKKIISFPVDASKLIPDPRKGAMMRDKLNMNDRIVILAVGRLIEKKGFQYLIDAVPSIYKKHSNIRFVIVGDGDLYNQLTNRVKRLKIQQLIIFPGNAERDKISQFYNMADIFVMPSIKDRSGNIDDQPVALIEAMSCGKPVIATNFPGIALTVKNGTNGILVKQKDSLAIKNAIIQLVNSKTLREKMGKESRKIITENLSNEIVGKKYSNVFKLIHE